MSEVEYMQNWNTDTKSKKIDRKIEQNCVKYIGGLDYAGT